MADPAHTLLQVGFVGTGTSDTSRTLIARVTNLSTESLSGVEVVIDVVQERNPSRVCGVRKLTNPVLAPGEGREVDLRYAEVTFVDKGYITEGRRTPTHIRDSSFVGDRLLNVILHA